MLEFLQVAAICIYLILQSKLFNQTMFSVIGENMILPLEIAYYVNV